MNTWEAIVPGGAPGLTEFLPVSNSGHTEPETAIVEIKSSRNLLFAIVVPTATGLSTAIVWLAIGLVAIFVSL